MYIFGFLQGPHVKIPLQNIRFAQIRGKWRKVYIGFFPQLSHENIDLDVPKHTHSSHKQIDEEEQEFETFVFE